MADAKPKVVQVSIPADLHRRFKLSAVDRGTTMADVLRAAIESYVKKANR